MVLHSIKGIKNKADKPCHFPKMLCGSGKGTANAKPVNHAARTAALSAPRARLRVALVAQKTRNAAQITIRTIADASPRRRFVEADVSTEAKSAMPVRVERQPNRTKENTVAAQSKILSPKKYIHRLMNDVGDPPSHLPA
jgi:hypothetical protein